MDLFFHTVNRERSNGYEPIFCFLDFIGLKRDLRIFFDIEEISRPQVAIPFLVSRINTFGLYGYVDRRISNFVLIIDYGS